MCIVRFIGCLHLGHESIAKYRGFDSSQEHDTALISNWNKVVNKKDLTYILGDVTMESDKFYYLLNQLNGRKIVILGNHDLPKHVRTLLNYVESVAGMVDYKGCSLTHSPIHPNEVQFYRANIHAHIHHKNQLEEVHTSDRYKDDGFQIKPTLNKYKNVDAYLIDFKPTTLEETLNL